MGIPLTVGKAIERSAHQRLGSLPITTGLSLRSCTHAYTFFHSMRSPAMDDR